MDGGIPDVVTRFVADMLPFIRNVRRGARAADDFGDENRRAAREARKMAVASTVAAHAVDNYADQLRDLAIAQRLVKSVSLLRSIGTSLAKIAAVGAALSVLAGGAAAGVVPIMNLVSALAPAVGLFAALPAAILGGAAAIATMVAIMPALQRELSAMKPMWDRVSKAAQNAFGSQIRGEAKKLAAVMEGPLRGGMTRVATSLGVLTRQVFEFARTSASVEAVRTIFGSVANMIDRIRPGMKPLLAGIRDLAVAGSASLERFGAAAGHAMAAFGQWMSRLAASGRVEQIINTAVRVLKQLGQIAKNVGSILGSVFSAANATGGGLLGTLQRLTGQAAAFLKSAEGSRVLKSIFQGLSDVGKALAPVFVSLLKGVGTLAPAIGRIAVAVGPVLTTAINALAPALAALEPGITAFVQGFGAGIKALAPALLPLANALSSVMIAVAPLLPVLGQLAATLLTALAPVIVAIAPYIVQFAAALGGALIQAIRAIAPHLPALAQSLGQLLIALIPLIGPITELVIAVTPLIPVFADVLVIVAQLATAVLPLLIAAIRGNIGVMKVLVGIVTFVWGFISGYIKFQIAIVRGVINWFGSLPGKFRDWFGRAKAAVSEKIGAMVAAVKALPGKIKNAIGNLGSLLYNAGKNVVQGLINGIYSMFGHLGSAASGLASTIRSYLPFSPAETGPLSGRGDPKYSGISIVRKLAGGIIASRGAVQTAMSILAGQVAGAQFTPGLAMAGVGRGAGTVVNNYYDQRTHVEGSIWQERDLLDRMQQGGLRRNVRNPSNMTSLPTGR